MKNAHAEHAKLLFLMHICDILVAIAIAFARGPYYSLAKG